MRGFEFKKAVQALNFLATKNGGTLNKMKAIKLVWLSDRLHIRKYGRLITEDEYYALPNGPVPSATRDILENSDFLGDAASIYASEYISAIDKYHFKSLCEPNMKVLSKTDKNTLDLIYEKFGEYDHYKLSDLSHLFPEWKRHESALNKKLSSRFQINKFDFFSDINEPSGLFINTGEAVSVSKIIYEENLRVLSVLR